MLKEQAQIFIDLKVFEVDMSFKRIRGPENNEIVFAAQYEQHGKSTLFS